jgi:hypothetical protein
LLQLIIYQAVVVVTFQSIEYYDDAMAVAHSSAADVGAS